MFFSVNYKIDDWSLNGRFISTDFFNSKVDNQRFKVKTCPNTITLLLENMLDGHIRISGNKKKSTLQV